MAAKAQLIEFLQAGVQISGAALASGKVYTYVAGSSATNKTTYTLADKSANQTNPVILDSDGKATVFADGAYKLVIKDSADVTQLTLDNLVYLAYDSPVREWVDPRDFGDGLLTLTNINLALTDIGSDEKTLYLATGNWTIDADVTIPSNVHLVFDRGAILDIATGKTVSIIGTIEAPLTQIFDNVGTARFNDGVSNGKVRIVYPQWWGADDSGTADSHWEIERACLAFKDPAYATVKLLGTFKVIHDVDITIGNLTIDGEGAGNVNSYGAINTFDIESAVDYVTVKNFSIVGDDTASSSGVRSAGTHTTIENCIIGEFTYAVRMGYALSATEIADVSYGTIKNNYCYMTSDDNHASPGYIHVYNGWGCLVEGNDVRLQVYDGATTYAVCLNIQNVWTSGAYTGENLSWMCRVANNHVRGGYDGIKLQGANIACTGNTIEDGEEYGIYIAGDTTVANVSGRNVSVVGNTVLNCDWAGIYGEDTWDGVSIVGNTITNCGKTTADNQRGAIGLSGGNSTYASRATIVGNVIDGRDNTGTRLTKYGINIDANSTYNPKFVTIANNQISSCALTGIYLLRAQYVTVQGNTIRDCVSGSSTAYAIHVGGGAAQAAYIDISGNILNGNDLTILVDDNLASTRSTSVDIRVHDNIGMPDKTALTSASSPYAIQSEDVFLVCNTAGGSITCNLPPADNYPDREIKFIKTVAANTLTIDPADADSIDGDTAGDAISATGIDSKVTLRSDGADWWTVENTQTSSITYVTDSDPTETKATTTFNIPWTAA